MKKFSLIFSMMLIVAFAFGQITGSGHDFSGTAWSVNDNSDAEICIACHTPHNAMVVANTPLWNHLVTTETFIPYTSPTMTGTTAPAPDGSALLCLSCHDGTTNLDAIDGGAGTAAMGAVDANFGLDLTTHHPISFDYATSQAADADIHLTTNGVTGAPGVTTVADLLFAGKVQCASCHDVHNGGNGPIHLLRKDNADSDFCLDCHDK